MTLDELATLTRRVIAREGFAGYQPTACFPARQRVAVLTGVPVDVDVEQASLEWAFDKAVGDEEVLVAFKVDEHHFKVVRRCASGLTQQTYAVQARGADAPDIDRLVAASTAVAEALHLKPASREETTRFLRELLFDSPPAGGRALWPAFVEHLVTPKELRDALLARLATWLCEHRGVPEQSSDLWVSADLEQSFDLALFPDHFEPRRDGEAP